MIPSRGVVACDGAWVHYFRHGDRPLRHRVGRHRHYRRATPRRRARSIPAGGCSSSIRMRANCAPLNVEIAIEGIAALLRGGDGRFFRSHARHDRHSRLQPARLRVRPHHPARRDPHLCAKSPAGLRASGAAHSVAQAIGRNPFMIIVPCHRVLEAGHYADKISPYGGVISKRRLLSIEGTHPTVQQDAVRRAAARCAAAARITRSAG